MTYVHRSVVLDAGLSPSLRDVIIGLDSLSVPAETLFGLLSDRRSVKPLLLVDATRPGSALLDSPLTDSRPARRQQPVSSLIHARRTRRSRTLRKAKIRKPCILLKIQKRKCIAVAALSTAKKANTHVRPAKPILMSTTLSARWKSFCRRQQRHQLHPSRIYL